MRFRRRRKPKLADWLRFHDQVRLRVYIDGRTIMGPLSLTDLAMIVKYGGYQNDGERSLIHTGLGPSDPMPFGVDITAEYEGPTV